MQDEFIKGGKVIICRFYADIALKKNLINLVFS